MGVNVEVTGLEHVFRVIDRLEQRINRLEVGIAMLHDRVNHFECGPPDFSEVELPPTISVQLTDLCEG